MVASTAPPGPGLLFTGGPILTMSEPARVEALAVRGDRIVGAGSLAECRDILGADRRELDLAGRCLLPGFVDAHVHGDLPLLADPLHEQGVRQGVTTHVIGQDGVAFAPASFCAASD